MKLLAIDTATEACSAALLIDNQIHSRYQLAPRLHAALILAMVDELLSGAGMHLNQLDALAFGHGPGAFTGVRIATGVIQGLAFGSGLPVIPVSTLATLAQGVASQHEHIISAIDARMGEIYWCSYTRGPNGIVIATADEQVSRPEQLHVQAGKNYFGVGTGWASYKDRLAGGLVNRLIGHEGLRYPRAEDMLSLARQAYTEGRLVDAAAAAPVYLRNKVTA